MTKNEFITLLHEALRKQNTADAAEIEAEYEQHFAFKLADGYSEEEISARLGDPKALAAQFEQPAPQQKQGCKPLVIAGLCFADLLGGMFYVLLIAWGIVMATVSLSSAVLAVCLLGKTEHCRAHPVGSLWLRCDSGGMLCRAGCACRCGMHLLCGISAAAGTCLCPLPAQCAFLRFRQSRTSPAGS